MLICSFLVARTACWDADCAANPEVTLAHALEEHVEIESLIACAERETVLVVGQEVTNHPLVARVFNGVVAISDGLVAVEVLVFHVAWTKLKVIVLEFALRGDARFELTRVVEVVGLEQTIGFVTPNLA